MLILSAGHNRQNRRYQWWDRHGRQIKSLDIAAGIFQPWLSPDEKRFIADRVDSQTGTYDLWMSDEHGANSARFTFDREMADSSSIPRTALRRRPMYGLCR
jgi:hypothetical protein